MIEVVSATRLSETEFWNKSPLGISLRRLAQDARLVANIAFENQRGLPEVFNARIDAPDRHDILVFIHDDVWIDDDLFADRIVESLKAFDVIGVAGNRRRVTGQPGWAFIDEKFTWDSKNNLSGRVAHGNDPFGAISDFGSVPAECELLDGVLLAAEKSTLKRSGVRFDPRFDFHFYDMDFCRSARKNGLRLGTWPIQLTHQSAGAFGSRHWADKYQCYLDKWEETAPIAQALQQAIAQGQAGRLREAEEGFRAVLGVCPTHADANHGLGVLLLQAKRADASLPYFLAALESDAAQGKYWISYIDALHKAGQHDMAVEVLNLAMQQGLQGVQVEALAARLEASGPDRVHVQPLTGGPGGMQPAAGEIDELVALFEQGKLEQAAAAAHAMTVRYPRHGFGWKVLGAVYKLAGLNEEALLPMQNAADLSPSDAESHYNLGLVLQELGRLHEAEACYRRTIRLDPSHAAAHSNLIFALDLAADISVPAMQDERRVWGKMHAEHLLQDIPHANIPDPEKRLRIGYVATDFRTNSASTIFGTMLFDYDRSRFDVYAYSNETETTALTERFQQNVTAWRNIFGMSDDEVADLIREDGIDILVDLAGHSRANRLTVFARKPAPIQVAAWGYSTGTGIKAIDALFSDAVLIPPEERPLYAEQVRYLPIFFSYYPCQTPPAVGPLPALTNGHVTFGTFTRMEKVTSETYQAWAAVLLAVPGSRMLFKNAEMDHESARARVTGYFTRAGVDAERLIFLGRTRWDEHMAAFNRVDIALDTFPQGGGVTTLEGISMGVPLVTLRWPTIGGRMGASILGVMGLSDWVAETSEQYVEIARRKAQDIPALAALRSQLRSRLKSSIVGDTQAYARVVEQEYLKLWHEWCANRSYSVASNAC